MLSITPSALTELQSYIKQNNIDSPFRVTMLNKGCAGMVLGLALDNQKQTDRSFIKDQLTFVIEENLLKQTGKIAIDYHANVEGPGFSISSENLLNQSSCTSSAGCSGCCS